MSLRIGDAGYRIIGPIASGGMGEVYKAEHVITRRVEAIKLLSGAATEQETERCLREIRLQASLSHPNIAAVYNAFRVNDDLVLVMELVEGEPLRGLLAGGPLPLGVALDYACQVLQAVGYANAHGVIHRDISPANIVVTPRGGIKLMDFGLAKAPSAPSQSLSGTYMGSPHYMSPEQVKDAASASARSDIYSVGAVLYEMVTGRKVFPGDSSFAVMQAQVETAPVPPLQIDATIPPALNQAILTALEKDPERRFPSADAFRAALEQVLPEVPAVAPAPPRPRRRTWLVPGLQFLATCAVILPVAYYAGARRPHEDSKFAPPVIEIRMPSPPAVDVPQPVAAIDPAPPPPAPPRRPQRAVRASTRDLSPAVIGEISKPSPVVRVIEPQRRIPEPAPPAVPQPVPQPQLATAAAAPPASEAQASEPEAPGPSVKEKKPNRVRRALGKILSPFH
jgi:serine/threonine-protein kinase